MNTRSGELFIGITVTLATLIVIVGILFLGRSDLLTGGTTVEVKTVNAAGVAVGDDVLFRGVVIGSVRDIRFTSDGVLLRLKLDGSPSIPSDSRFVIRSTGVLGGRAIEIRPGEAQAYLRNGEQVPGEAEPDLLAAASKGVEAVGDQLQRTLSDLDGILRNLQAGRGSVGRAMKDEELYDNLNETVLLLKKLLEDIQANPKKYFTIRIF